MPILNTATIHFFIQNQLKFRPSRTINLFATMASADFCRLMYHHFARLNLRLPQTSLGKVNIFQSIAAASTTYALASKPAECVLDVGEMCHLIRHKQPLMHTASLFPPSNAIIGIWFYFIKLHFGHIRQYRPLQSRLLQCMGRPKPPCGLLTVRAVTPACKRLSLSRNNIFLYKYIVKQQIWQ